MRKNILRMVFVGLVLLGLAGFVVIRFGFFPVLTVNAGLVSEARFEAVVHEILSEKSAQEGALASYDAEVQRAALSKLIEEELIYREAEKYFGSSIRATQSRESTRALLSDMLVERKITLDEWIIGAKQDARILIFIGGFAWNGREVVKE